MKIQYGQFLTLLLALNGAFGSSLDEVWGGIPQSQFQLDDLLNDITPMDFAKNNDYGKNFDYDMLTGAMGQEDPSKSVSNDVEKNEQDMSESLKAPGSTMLPSYCDPPNPCPIGYTTADGCLEDFENSSEFSRRYQATQKCICDSEHMFDCPRQEASRGPEAIQAVNMISSIPGFEQMSEGNNPYLDGHKLPVAAKKGNF